MLYQIEAAVLKFRNPKGKGSLEEGSRVSHLRDLKENQKERAKEDKSQLLLQKRIKKEESQRARPRVKRAQSEAVQKVKVKEERVQRK
mmetsp:Transcript_7811/g.5864  ORF Transcript_7811/g.5864 Transcript_7811/m.5864 type:complete len:88 (-) Transcript_7811:447-710(-)